MFFVVAISSGGFGFNSLQADKMEVVWWRKIFLYPLY